MTPDHRAENDQQDVTRLLAASSEGSEAARDRLLEVVYGELKRAAAAQMRGERPDHTLSATALVSEAYVRLFKETGEPGGPQREPWSGRAGFYAAATTMMRRILIDHARAKASQKRGGPNRRTTLSIPIDAVEASRSTPPEEILALDDAISRLKDVDARAAEVVRLRFFGGLEIAEAAAALGVSERSVKRDWQFARAWLRNELGRDGPADTTDE
jgi:RNA polymerase sigma-70 factor (ECF subfamily)